MKTVNAEIQKIIQKAKVAQSRIQTLVKDQSWLDEARTFADRQKKEVKKLLTSDVAKVKIFLERERHELEKFQAQIPGEVKKLKALLQKQKKELEKLMINLKKAGQAPVTKAKKKAAPRKKAAKKAASPAPSAQA